MTDAGTGVTSSVREHRTSDAPSGCLARVAHASFPKMLTRLCGRAQLTAPSACALQLHLTDRGRQRQKTKRHAAATTLQCAWRCVRARRKLFLGMCSGSGRWHAGFSDMWESIQHDEGYHDVISLERRNPAPFPSWSPQTNMCSFVQRWGSSQAPTQVGIATSSDMAS